MSTIYHPQTDGQSKRTIQTMKDMLRTCLIDLGGSWDTYLPLVELSYINSYHTSINGAHFEALYGRKYRLPLCWLETRDRQLTRLDVIQETIDRSPKSKKRLRQLEPTRKVLSKVGPVTYQLELPQKLRGIQDVFHVSNLKKFLTDETLVVPLEELHITDKLQFIDKPLEIMDHWVKRPKHSRIPIVKVRWNSQRSL
ncbi:putative reverse transcriptase domain-containing protein [Tanacetum coccineum]